ncbi:MAG TPA: hypothetical protein VEJ67_02825 [Candidatus Cybelea sp.]|nr:hypothetical protein [Candidatus Cybelea sp.]
MPTETKVSAFKPPQPQVPGVPSNEGDRQKALRAPQAWSPSPALWTGLAAAVLVLITVVVLWRGFRAAARQPAPRSVSNDAPALPLSAPVVEMPVGPGKIATRSELAGPWSSRRFLFRDAQSGERTPALAVRLPGGELWGILLRAPYGTCDLQYLTDLAELRSKYGISAKHPMVVNPCTETVYDLAQYGNSPNGLVRGEIVEGSDVRPPIAIEVVERGDQVIAVRSE